MTPVKVLRGDGPVVLGLPHTGTHVPDAVAGELNARGLGLEDTDWHIDRLYDGGYTSVTNGRFKGGWTTRHYGRSAEGLHAIQMELTQSAYLAAESAPWSYDDDRASRLRPHLARILDTIAGLAPQIGGFR